MAAFHFEIVSPEQLVFSGEALSVTVPGVEGEFTVLSGHAPLISNLKPGVVTIEEAAAQKRQIFVPGGFAEVGLSGLTILADLTIEVTELDASQLDAEIGSAEAAVAAATSDEGRRVAAEKRDQLQELKAALKI
ncbi:MAG: F0F1 ATP synthase subunit epsilon [Alphaproteobacteria bacterium]|nr:F0F1 ATP synthase subunit epsilon [Alphaproteobacteria bacterium]